MKKTDSGFAITTQVWTSLPSTASQRKAKLSAERHGSEYKTVLDKPWNNFEEIEEGVYLTGLGGINKENIAKHKIALIVNASYEGHS